ncbi:MAG: pilus assembly protein [Selenomonadaceae bacterium]|nr:pilus assembly protein [Selenomonadaceae bacterium]
MTDWRKGQSMVEFALVVPMLVFLFLGIMYLGITFMDYTQYNNAARDAARDISLQSDFNAKKNLKDKINSKNNAAQVKRYATQLTTLYTATWHAEFLDKDGNPTTDQQKALDVHIAIDLARPALPQVLEDLDILPTNLKTIEYKMSLENK